MTETQAKSGPGATSATPVDEEAAESGAPATGRAAVGRAVVPADGPSPKYTRAPGMPPPPDQPPAEADGRSAGSSPDGAANPAGGSDWAQSGAGSASGADGPASGATGRASGPSGSVGPAGPADAVNSTIPIPSGGTPGGAGRPGSSGVGAQAKAAAQSVIGLAKSAGLGRLAPSGGNTNANSSRPGTGGTSQARTGSVPGRPGTARTASGPMRTPGGPATGGGGSAVGAARVTEAVRAARGNVGSAASRGPRRARLNVKRIDPWSVMKFSFAVSLVLFIVVIVATSVLYLALDAMGVFESVNSSLTDLINAGSSQNSGTFRITAKGVILTSALIGLINVVLFTALATLGAFVYNVCADLVGGIELTLAERD